MIFFLLCPSLGILSLFPSSGSPLTIFSDNRASSFLLARRLSAWRILRCTPLCKRTKVWAGVPLAEACRLCLSSPFVTHASLIYKYALVEPCAIASNDYSSTLSYPLRLFEHSNIQQITSSKHFSAGRKCDGPVTSVRRQFKDSLAQRVISKSNLCTGPRPPKWTPDSCETQHPHPPKKFRNLPSMYNTYVRQIKSSFQNIKKKYFWRPVWLKRRPAWQRRVLLADHGVNTPNLTEN